MTPNWVIALDLLRVVWLLRFLPSAGPDGDFCRCFLTTWLPERFSPNDQ